MAYNLKSEEEVREYLKNLYIEYRFGCDSEKNPEVCHLLGDYEESINNDIEKAVKIYKTNCDERSFARSCAKYGGFAAVGKGCKQDMLEGYKYSKKGCHQGDAYGCLHAGAIATMNEHIDEKDYATQITKGIEMLKKSCWQHNLEKGCYQLSSIYIAGIEDHVEPNMVEAYKASLKSCEAGNPYACSNVAVMHKRGTGVEKNENLADIFKKRAIELQRELTETQRALQFQQGISD